MLAALAPPITYTRPLRATTPAPWRGVESGGALDQVPAAGQIEHLHGIEAARQGLAADGVGFVSRGRAGAELAPRRRQRGPGAPALGRGIVDVHIRALGVGAAEPAADHVQLAAVREAGHVLAGSRERALDGPVAVARVEHHDVAHLLLVVAHAAGDVESSRRNGR